MNGSKCILLWDLFSFEFEWVEFGEIFIYFFVYMVYFRIFKSMFMIVLVEIGFWSFIIEVLLVFGL